MGTGTVPGRNNVASYSTVDKMPWICLQWTVNRQGL